MKKRSEKVTINYLFFWIKKRIIFKFQDIVEKNVFYLLKSPYFQLVTKLGAFKRSKHPAEIDSHEQLLEVVEKWRKTAWSWSRTGGLQDEDYPRPRLG